MKLLQQGLQQPGLFRTELKMPLNSNSIPKFEFKVAIKFEYVSLNTFTFIHSLSKKTYKQGSSQGICLNVLIVCKFEDK